jgi:hypothetical protein
MSPLASRKIKLASAAIQIGDSTLENTVRATSPRLLLPAYNGSEAGI